MRTYLTRLTMTAAGAVLTGASLAGVAHAGDDVFVDPSVLENLELEPCDELTASEDLLFPVDPDEPHTPLPPGEIDLVPCYQLPTEPEDDDGDGDDADPGDDGDDQEPGNDGGGDGGNGGGNGGNDDNGGGGSGDDAPSGGSGGEPSGDDGDSDETSGGAGDDQASGPASHQDDVTPAAASSGGDDTSLMLAVLAGALGTAGLLILIYGLRKRPRRGYQPAR